MAVGLKDLDSREMLRLEYTLPFPNPRQFPVSFLHFPAWSWLPLLVLPSFITAVSAPPSPQSPVGV